MKIRAALVVGFAVVGLAACTQAQVAPADAYKIGCPALDAAVGGGSVAGKAGAAGLKALRDSGQVNAEASGWLDAAIQLLESGDPNAIPADARALLVNGCADNGYPLQNLTKA